MATLHENPFTGFATAITLVALAPAASAQTIASALIAYTGPRYPGGPDSLRALVARSTQRPAPVPTGRMLVQFELRPDGRPYHFSIVRPPMKEKALANATATALQYLEAHMLPWQPATNDGKAPTEPDPKISLLVDFTTPPANQPYHYAEQNPVFTPVIQTIRAQYTRAKGRTMTEAEMQESFAFGTSAKGVAQYIQFQVRYPAQALRNMEEGRVYAYFEVAESGIVEQATILGSAGSNLDTEVLRIIKNIPTAVTPPLLKGQPVRAYYVLPITFKIQ